MSWEDILKHVFAAIASIGGVAGLICLAVKFTSDRIAESLAKKYEHKLEKALEEHKSKLEHKNYVSKTRFDVEFAIYRELSKNFFILVEDMNRLFPICSYQLEDKALEKEQYELANKTAIEAQRALYSNAAFMPEIRFDEYKAILNLCNEQLIAYRDKVYKNKDRIDPEIILKTEEVQKKFDELNNTIRDYLSKLDVLD